MVVGAVLKDVPEGHGGVAETVNIVRLELALDELHHDHVKCEGL